ncbi:MAG: hypothetical protein WBN74_10385, partial [Candidatus Sulfotelmatobacter sp.]
VMGGIARTVGIENELAERALLFRGTLEQEKHALGGKGIGHRAPVVARLGERMHIAPERDADTVLNPLRSERRWLGLGEPEAAGYSGE